MTALRWACLPLACLCLHGCSLLFEPIESGLKADASTLDGDATPLEGDATKTEGPIVFHAVSFGTADTGVLQFTHTIEPGEGRLLLVSSHAGTDSFSTGSVTFDTGQLTPIGGEIEFSAEVGEDCNSTLWYLIDPPVGTFEVVATLDSETGSIRRMASWAMSFSGVDLLNPISATLAGAEPMHVAAASLDISSSSGDLVVDGICFGQPAPASLVAGDAQTVRINKESVDNRLQVAGSIRPGVGPSTIMSWTHDLGPHTHYSVALRPAR